MENMYFVMTDGCNATCFASASIRVSSSFKHVCVYKKKTGQAKNYGQTKEEGFKVVSKL